jgi:hypothetical protein
MYPNAFETDVMDDLSFDEAEGPATGPQAYADYDPYAESGYGDEYDTYDEEAADDEFISGMIRPGGASHAEEFEEYDEGFDEADDYEGMEAYDEFETEDSLEEYEEGDAFEEEVMDPFEAFEDAVADALAAEDSDEFLRRIRRRLRRLAGRVRSGVRRVTSGIGRLARRAAPIAGLIPLPQAQAISRIAGVAGRLLADGADEYEALDAMIDMAGEEDVFDEVAPLIAGLALRAGTPRLARAALPVRREAVRDVAHSVKLLARRQGPHAARAAVRAARAVGRQPIPVSAIPSTIRRLTPKIARSARQLRRLSRPLASGGVARSLQRMDEAAAGMRPPLARRRRRLAGGLRPVQRRRRSVVPGPGGQSCPTCHGRPRQLLLRGPVTLTLHSRL